MAFLKVKVLDKTTLQLEDDGKKGDQIDLTKVISVDQNYINNLLNKEIETEMNKRISNAITKEKEVFEKEIARLQLELNNKHNNEIAKIKDELNEQLKDKEIELNNIKNENDSLIKQQDDLIKIKVNEKEKELREQINQLKNSLDKVESEHKTEITSIKYDYDKQISELKLSKARYNVKEIGENLEYFCDNEVKNLMQNGLENCSWFKDTKPIKDEEDDKATKADYILKIYPSKNHIEKELLTSICFEMKDEYSVSQNKKQNKDHFNKLDRDRQKKNCEYAVLVSNLERDKPNDLLIYKVNDYDNMYVVRPEYLTIFINMIVSLNKLHAHLINKSKSDFEHIKKIEDVKNEFDKLKETYLDNPLQQLSKRVEEINKANESIINANLKIKEASDKIKTKIEEIQKNYMDKIKEKLEKFSINIQKEYKKNSI